MFKFLREKISGWMQGKKESEKEKVKEKKVEKHKKKPIKKTDTEIKETTEKQKKIKEKPEKKEKEKLIGEEGKQGKQERVFEEEVSEEKTKEELDSEKKSTAEYEKEVFQGEGNFFTKLLKKISSSKLDENSFNEMFMEFELVLLENNVALEVVDKIKEVLSKELIGKQFKKSEAGQKILEALKESVDSVLIESENLIEQIRKKEGIFVILFFGINGSGKTTTIAKLAHLLKKNSLSCVLAAADTFRAASIEQLEEHANRLGVPIVKHDYQADPAAVGFDAIQFAKKNHKKVVLIDTAGRMYTKANLMKEMEKIVRVTKPDLKIFVGESITGNDATEQAKTFNSSVGIDGIILSKADVDERAGTILSVSFVTKKPIYYLGIGQNYADLQEFKKEEVFRGLGLE